MSHLIFNILLALVSLAGVLSISLRAFPPGEAHRTPHPAWWLAGSMILSAFVLYLEVILLGSFGLLSAFPLAGLNLAAVGALAGHTRRVMPALRQAASDAVTRGTGSGAPRLALFCVLYTSFVNLATIFPTNDFLSYHLANILNFMDSASTASVDPSLWPLTAPLFYTRGMESILTPFFLFDLPREGTVLFGALGIAVLYFSVRSALSHRTWGDLIFCLLITTNTVQENLLWVKNDVLIGALTLFLVAPILRARPGREVPWLALAAAAGLLLSLKTNGALYGAVALAVWLFPRPGMSLGMLARILAVALPPGLYFYAANTFQTGHPLYPFRLDLSAPGLLSGGPLSLATTTILGNLDAGLPAHLLRGAVRALGPAALLPVLIASLLIFSAVISRRGQGPRATRRGLLIPLWLMMTTLFLWLATPFSDNTGLAVHRSLYSGQSLRFAFPFLFLAAVLAARSLLGGRTAEPPRAVLGFTCVMAGVNLFWYDLAAMALKPGNAFAALAPVARTFSNGLLLLAAAAIATGSVLLALKPRRTLILAWLVSGAALFHLGWPGSLGWALELKQQGEPSAAFQVLDSLGRRYDSISVHRRNDGTLQTGLDYLLAESFTKVDLMKDPSRPPRGRVLVYGVEAKTEIADMVEGRRTSLDWDYMKTVSLPSGYLPVLEDPYFRIYSRPALAEP